MTVEQDRVDQIAAAVDALHDRQTAFIQKLVQLPSLPGEERQAQRFAAEAMRELDLEVEVVESRFDELRGHPAFCDDGLSDRRINVVGRWRGVRSSGGAPGKSLILNGHMDVVSPGHEELWSVSPWSGLVRDGRLYGRGSCDMKSGLASALFAVAALQRVGFAPAADVLIESVSGEETGGVGTLTTIVKGYRADAAVILEPTRLRVCPVQSGALTFRLTVSGRATHACMKTSGVSAIEKACQLLEAINALDRRRHGSFHNPLYPDPSNVAPISVGTIRGGDWHSMVPNQVVLEGRCGVLPGEPVETTRRVLSDAITEASRDDPWLAEHPPVLEWFEATFEAGETARDAPIVQMLRARHAAVLGTEASIEGVTYGSDLRLFTNHAGIPAVLYGPGDIVHAHAVDEFIELSEVTAATKVIAALIHDWCGTAGRA